MSFQSPLPDKIRSRDLSSVFGSFEKDPLSNNISTMIGSLGTHEKPQSSFFNRKGSFPHSPMLYLPMGLGKDASPLLALQSPGQRFSKNFYEASETRRVLFESNQLENDNFLSEQKLDRRKSLLQTPAMSRGSAHVEEQSPFSNMEHRGMSLGFDSALKKPPKKRAGPPKAKTEAVAAKKNSRGLKTLSYRVRDIVCEKQKTSYKEVAEILIRETKSKELLSKKLSSREEQNVKRRVYDALNVLIASKILTKHGKVVEFNPRNPGHKSEINTGGSRSALALKLEQDRNWVAEKARYLRDRLAKLLVLQKLFLRNRASPLEASVQFPFIMVSPEKKTDTKVCAQWITSQILLDMLNKKRKLSVQSNNPISFYGDLEAVMMLERLRGPLFADQGRFDDLLPAPEDEVNSLLLKYDSRQL